jgi:RND superfamily putative drug exporter
LKAQDSLLARLVYKLGLFSAKRAWLVILSWLIILGTAVSLMVGFSGKLSSSMSIDGIPAQEVIDSLQESFPEAARGQGQAVFHKDDAPFTDAEKQLISEALEETRSVFGVATVIDPFATAQDIADQRQELADGEVKLAEAEAEIADGKAEIESGRAELESGQAELNTQ